MYPLYRRLSPLIKSLAKNLGLAQGTCRFHPTCSEYAVVAFRRRGPFLGTWLTLRRLLKCHPWSRGGYDPVP